MKNNKSNKPATVPPKQEQAQVIATAQGFVGPIPHPEIFRQYGLVVPDAPERILKVFEQDSQHTREMQKAALKAETARDTRAQWMAYTVMMALIGLTAFAIRYGNTASGIAVGLATMFMALKVLFIKKNDEPNKQQQEK